MRSARVAAFIAFHYRMQTMQFLDRVLRNLCEFEVDRMHVTVITSTEDGAEQALLRSLCRNYFVDDSFAVAAYPDCQPPTLLPWMHKPLLQAAATEQDFTHFIYSEDDIGLTYANFRYFLEYADALREFGLIPSFVRTEFAEGVIRSCDAPYSTVATRLIELPGCTFAAPGFPYSACFVMDRKHVAEYLASRSSDVERSIELTDWDLRERAAMGLCWENPPAGFHHRYVVPVGTDLRPLACCQVTHMPANYAPMNESAYAKVPIERLFVRPGTPLLADGILQRLRTHTGSVVFLDSDSGALRHGPEDSSPGNLFLTQREGVGYLVAASADGSLRELPQTWAVVPGVGDTVGLQSDGLYLTALPDGSVPLSGKLLLAWEQFSLEEGRS